MLPGSVSKLHAPPHWLFQPGVYMVTVGTYRKLPHWNSPERLDFLLAALHDCAAEFGWTLQAWALLTNHYHFIAGSPPEPATLPRFLGKLHMTTAKQLNLWDAAPGRKVWYQYWDSQITFEGAYLARLNYVHHNPQHHRVVDDARDYRWCSARWFAENSPEDFRRKVAARPMDRLGVADDY